MPAPPQAPPLQAPPPRYLRSGSHLGVLVSQVSSESLPDRCRMLPLMETGSQVAEGAPLRSADRTWAGDGAA